MPTYRTIDAVVHEAVIISNNVRLRCDDKQKGITYDGPLRTHEDLRVTCMGCLAEAPLHPPVFQFMVCDACSGWWAEHEETLIPVNKAYVETLETYTVLERGTLPKCPTCR